MSVPCDFNSLAVYLPKILSERGIAGKVYTNTTLDGYDIYLKLGWLRLNNKPKITASRGR